MLALLSCLQEILLSVIKVWWHEPRIIFASRSFERSQIGSISFAALVEGNMAKHRRFGLDRIHEILEDRDVHVRLLSGTLPFDVRSENDVGNVLDAGQSLSQVGRVEKVRGDLE